LRQGTLMGSQTPSARVCPEYAYTDGEDAVKVLAIGHLYTDPWQSGILDDWQGHAGYRFRDRMGRPA